MVLNSGRPDTGSGASCRINAAAHSYRMYTADATKPAYDSQPGPLDPFTTGLIQIVIEPPEQRRLENTSICCPSRPTTTRNRRSNRR